jgi:hypothetical protein
MSMRRRRISGEVPARIYAVAFRRENGDCESSTEYKLYSKLSTAKGVRTRDSRYYNGGIKVLEGTIENWKEVDDE